MAIFASVAASRDRFGAASLPTQGEARPCHAPLDTLPELRNRAMQVDTGQPIAGLQPGCSVVMRNWRSLLGGSCFCACVAALFGWFAIAGHPPGGPSDYGYQMFSMRSYTGTVAALFAGMGLRCPWVRVTVRAEGLRVHNFWTTRWVRWPEIAAFAIVASAARRGPVVATATVVQRGGRVRKLAALSAMDHAKVYGYVERLRALAPPGLRPPFVAAEEMDRLLEDLHPTRERPEMDVDARIAMLANHELPLSVGLAWLPADAVQPDLQAPPDGPDGTTPGRPYGADSSQPLPSP